MTPTIKTEALTKDYGGGRGLFDLDLEKEGEVFGYLRRMAPARPRSGC